jgi:hypothetical protein
MAGVIYQKSLWNDQRSKKESFDKRPTFRSRGRQLTIPVDCLLSNHLCLYDLPNFVLYHLYTTLYSIGHNLLAFVRLFPIELYYMHSQ